MYLIITANRSRRHELLQLIEKVINNSSKILLVNTKDQINKKKLSFADSCKMS